MFLKWGKLSYVLHSENCSKWKPFFKYSQKQCRQFQCLVQICPSWRKPSNINFSQILHHCTLRRWFFFFPLRMHFYLTIAQENKVTACALGLEFRVWKWQSDRENIWIVEIQSTFTTNSLITYINWLANTISFIYFFNYWKKNSLPWESGMFFLLTFF